MRPLIRRFLPYLLHAGLFSLVINLLLLVPALYMLQLFDRVISSRSDETLVMLSLGAALAIATLSVLDILRARLLASLGIALDRRLGPVAIDGLLASLMNLRSGDAAGGPRDVATLRAFLCGPGVLALLDAPWLPAFLLLILLLHPLLGALAAFGAITMIAIAIANERATRKPLERAREESRKAAAFGDSIARSAEVVCALGMKAAATDRWARRNEQALHEQAEASHVGGLFAGLTKFARQFIQMAMLGAGAYLVLRQSVSAGTMVAASVVMGRALAPVEMLVAGWRDLVEARAAWRRLDRLLADNPPTEIGLTLPTPTGHVLVERLVFGFPGAERATLRDITFDLPAGQSLGVIGPTAAGKSTLVRLIIGLWKPASGAVRLDGADVSTWPRDDLGSHVGYVPQAVDLFEGTVAENIGRLAVPDSDAVVRAARRAHAHDMILRLPAGYETAVGEGGKLLSPGQRQRIALARALYGDPRLVVLDEPNANLDTDGDAALLATLGELRQQGVTVIVVAHRPSLLGGMDRLLVLREGLLEMFGPHAEVTARVTRHRSDPLGIA